MALAIMHGTGTCVAASACYALAFSLMRAKRLSARLLTFIIASAVCGAFLYGTAYQFVRATVANQILAMILSGLVIALVSFGFHSLLASTADFWMTSKGLWWERFRVHLPLFVNSLIAATGATVIAMFNDSFILMPLMVAPLIGFMWGRTRAYKARLSRIPAN